jgi:hypothetical protein
MHVTIAALGNEAPPSKHIEGYFRFLCPHCGELNATVNPKNNLAHCFCCRRNFNNLDLLVEIGHDYRTAVALLEQLLVRHQSQNEKRKNHTPPIARK